MNEQTHTAPPGWYPDPRTPGTQRWWDGQQWGPAAQPVRRKGMHPALKGVLVVLAIVVGLPLAYLVSGVAGGAESDAEPEPVGLNDFVTTDDGVQLTVTSVACGLPAQPDPYGDLVEPRGEFCAAEFTVANKGTESERLSMGDFLGQIGGRTFEPDYSISTLGGERWSEHLNPGLSLEGVAFWDVPKGATLDAVVLDMSIWDDPVVITVK